MSRSAMTLVELLVALTLSAMLMAVLFTMLGQQSRTNRRLEQSQPFEPWLNRLKEQIESDYCGCRHVQIQPDRIVFDGYSGSEPEESSGPSRITWFITSSEQGNWLFREHVNLLSNQPDRTRREFVGSRIIGFESQTRLATDVAPGILRMSIRMDREIESMSDSEGVEPIDDSVPLVLVRHGGFQ